MAPAAGLSAPSLLASHDLGRTWQPLALSAGTGPYPQIAFFGPADGVLVAAGPQEALGTVFYTTADGGRSWTPPRQGRHFTQYGASIDLATPGSASPGPRAPPRQARPPRRYT